MVHLLPYPDVVAGRGEGISGDVEPAIARITAGTVPIVHIIIEKARLIFNKGSLLHDKGSLLRDKGWLLKWSSSSAEQKRYYPYQITK